MPQIAVELLLTKMFPHKEIPSSSRLLASLRKLFRTIFFDFDFSLRVLISNYFNIKLQHSAWYDANVLVNLENCQFKSCFHHRAWTHLRNLVALAEPPTLVFHKTFILVLASFGIIIMSALRASMLMVFSRFLAFCRLNPHLTISIK